MARPLSAGRTDRPCPRVGVWPATDRRSEHQSNHGRGLTRSDAANLSVSNSGNTESGATPVNAGSLVMRGGGNTVFGVAPCSRWVGGRMPPLLRSRIPPKLLIGRFHREQKSPAIPPLACSSAVSPRGPSPHCGSRKWIRPHHFPNLLASTVGGLHSPCFLETISLAICRSLHGQACYSCRRASSAVSRRR